MDNTITNEALHDLEEVTTSTYHANHLITDKVIFNKSLHFGKKGESFYLKNGDQWYFKPKGETDFIRVKWYFLESNVSDGSYGQAKYTGLNPSIYGKVGELAYIGKQWVFQYDGEKYNLNSPESVELS